MSHPGSPQARSFDEPRWLDAQAARGRWLHGIVEARLAAEVADPLLRSRLRARAVRGASGQIDSPVTFALCLAESLGLAGAPLERLAAAGAFFWAAADTADDLDDRDLSGGLHPADLPATANDACALLMLAHQLYLEAGPALATRAARFGMRMAAGQAHDLATTDRPSPPDVLALARDKAGAELALFFAQIADAAGAETEAYARLGEAFGVALQLFSDVADLYVKPVPDDFVAGKWNLALYYYRRDAEQAGELWSALDRTRPDVHARIRFEAAAAAARSLEGAAGDVLTLWEPLRNTCADPEPFDAATAWVLRTLETTAEAIAALEEAAPPSAWSSRQAVTAAVRYLSATDFAEEHRWGLFGKPLVRGDLFASIWRAAALRTTGGDWQPVWRTLLAMRDADGWRYFPHERAIPPDADDAGLLLGYFGDVMSSELREATLRQLIGAFEPAGIHTWLAKPEGDVEWEGDDCPATLANAVWGLVTHGAGREIPRGVWRRLISLAAENDYTSPFYVTPPVRYFVHRALATAVVRREIGPDEAGVARRRLEADLAQARRLAGNTAEDPLTCACDVLAGAAWGLRPPASVSHWLADRQRIDGSWAEAPLFRTPGIHFRPYYWGHPALTTAFVAKALQAAAQ